MKKLFLLIAAMGYFVLGYADMKPQWVSKGVAYLNKEKSNNTYQFVSFDTHDVDQDLLKRERLKPLIEFIEHNYGAVLGTVSPSNCMLDGREAFMFQFDIREGSQEAVYAMPIDEYSEYDDYEENAYEWEYYQLYALSYPGVEPEFDYYMLTKPSKVKATVYSIIPGMGQLYKGQTTKGWLILGGEALFVSSAIAFELKRHYCRDKVTMEPEVADSWKSKARGWRTFRNASLGCAVGLYIYNLIDAATSEGARRVQVKKSIQHQFTLMPYADIHSAGLYVAINF